MVIIKIAFESLEHPILIFIGCFELISQQLLMELFFLNIYLFLVSNNHVTAGNSLREFHLESKLLLFFFLNLYFISLSHKAAWTRLFKNIVNRCVLVIIHLDNDFKIFLVENFVHIWNFFLMLVSMEFLIFSHEFINNLFVIFIKELTTLTVQLH